MEAQTHLHKRKGYLNVSVEIIENDFWDVYDPHYFMVIIQLMEISLVLTFLFL